MLKIAPLPQPQHREAPPAAGLSASQEGAARWLAVLVGISAFFCFMPYLAIPAGNNTAVQVGTLFTLVALIPIFFAKARRGPIWIFLLMMAPLCISILKVGFDERDGDIVLCFKFGAVLAMSCLTMVATQYWAPRHALALLTGIAVAAIIHTIVGVWQLYAFSTGGDLPLTWLYINPSFLSVQEYADTISQYIQRPFGLFPEPSAMSSSLAPFVLFWIAELCGIVKLKAQPARWQRTLFAIAALGSLALIICSQSGHAAVTILAIVLLVAIWFIRSKATAASFLAVALVFGVAMPVTLYFAATQLSTRVGGESNMGNNSWGDRTESLQLGFSLLVDRNFPTVIFGVGPGQTSPALMRNARLEAVWSVLLTYIYETGLVGLAAVIWIGVFLLRQWNSNGRNIAFVAILVVWLVGVCVTTSYGTLLTLWVTLGWLTIWPAICVTPERSPRSRRAPSLAPSPIVEDPAPDSQGIRVHAPPLVSHGWRDPDRHLPIPIPSPADLVSSSPAVRWSDMP